MEEFHTSPTELASIASRAKPKVLVLYHCVGFATPAQFVESVAANYHDGPVIYANDLAVF
jgi:ribonuclease BN (tRNA processing enzyme)